MKRKTIAIIGENYIGTGKGLYPVELAKSLNKISKKYKIKLFLRDTAPFYDSKLVIKVKTFKTKIRILSGLGYYIPLFFKLLKGKSIDFIHAYDEKTNIVAALAKKPRVVTAYDMYPLVYYKFPINSLFKILYRCLNLARKIIVISNNTGILLAKEYPFLSKKIIPIHLGVDTTRFKPVSVKKKNYISVGILGNLDRELCNVFEKLLQEYGKKIKIIIGGKDIPKEFDYLSSDSRVIFNGFIEEAKLPRYYQDIDIFIYKTDIAAFELITVEAMASGCAVIGSDVGALPEVFKDGGYLVKNTEKAFYESIKKMIDNEKLRKRYQKNGRKRAKELTWDRCAKKHLEVYDMAFTNK